jgi:hypothetical protein
MMSRSVSWYALSRSRPPGKRFALPVELDVRDDAGIKRWNATDKAAGRLENNPTEFSKVRHLYSTRRGEPQRVARIKPPNQTRIETRFGQPAAVPRLIRQPVARGHETLSGQTEIIQTHGIRQR